MSNPYESPLASTTGVSGSDWLAKTQLEVNKTARTVESFFQAEGYRLESGDNLDGVYGIGNNILRILFGAFVKRYKFKVRVLQDGSGSIVVVDKGMSGAMGGVIGFTKMKKELARIREGVQSSIVP